MTFRLAASLAAAAAVIVVSFAAPEGENPPVASAAPLTFHCALDATCPGVLVAGDPYATIGANPSPFRGYGDPSLERDPATGALWLSYSWLDVLVTNPGPSQSIDFGVETHLGRSDDGGASFTFVEAVNQMTPVTHPDTSASGWESHEVSTLVREGPNSWQMMWLSYFDPPGSQGFFDVRYERALGSLPDTLGAPVEWARGISTSQSWGSQHNLSAIPQLADCAAFTEPALFQQDGVTYLATNCVVFSGGVRQDAQERLVLLKQEAVGYSFVGNLLDGQDAVDAGGTRIEQADIALSQTGEVLLIGTPIQSAAPNHLGCVVFEITDISTASVLRDGGGDAVQLAYLTGEDGAIGPGLCTYDAASDTGILMVLHIYDPSPFDMEFSMRATGVHPMDTDGDGVENSQDPEDDGDGYSDEAESGVPLCTGSANDDNVDDLLANDGCPSVDTAEVACSNSADDDFDSRINDGCPQAGAFAEGAFNIGTTSLEGCGPGVGPDPGSAWPSDLVSGGVPVSTDRITIGDLASFLAPVRRLDSSPGDPQFSARSDLSPGRGIFMQWINISDLSTLLAGATGFPPMLGGSRAFNGAACS
jgi:hypothetical protein